MTGYRFDVTCPMCGGELSPCAGGTSNGWETRAAAECVECSRIIVIAARLTVDPRPRTNNGNTGALPREHGTNRGYHQHNKRGERPCRACLAAHSIYGVHQRLSSRNRDVSRDVPRVSAVGS